jgi:hypothetical protein
MAGPGKLRCDAVLTQSGFELVLPSFCQRNQFPNARNKKSLGNGLCAKSEPSRVKSNLGGSWL